MGSEKNLHRDRLICKEPSSNLVLLVLQAALGRADAAPTPKARVQASTWVFIPNIWSVAMPYQELAAFQDGTSHTVWCGDAALPFLKWSCSNSQWQRAGKGASPCGNPLFLFLANLLHAYTKTYRTIYSFYFVGGRGSFGPNVFLLRSPWVPCNKLPFLAHRMACYLFLYKCKPVVNK